MITVFRGIVLAIVLASGSVLSAMAAESSYPTKAIRIINPFSPGGAVDVVSRSVAQKMNESWGQAVMVDNRPGAGTTIGTEMVIHAAPDGYTLLLT